jgi:hypothetical protein
MLRRIARSRLARYGIIPVLLASTSACYKWTDVSPGAPMPDQVRLTYGDHACLGDTRSIYLDQPAWMVNGAVEGTREGPGVDPATGATHYTRGIVPANHVCRVETSEFQPLKTVGGVLLTVGTVFMIGAGIALSQWEWGS